MKVLFAKREQKMLPSKPQNWLNRLFITIIGNMKVQLTEGEVLTGEAREAWGVESERVDNIVGDVSLLEDVEVVTHHHMDLLEFGSLNEEGQEKETIFFKAVVGLMEEGVLVGVVEEALNINHVVNRHTRYRLSEALNISNNEITLYMAAVRPVVLAELNVAS